MFENKILRIIDDRKTKTVIFKECQQRKHDCLFLGSHVHSYINLQNALDGKDGWHQLSDKDILKLSCYLTEKIYQKCQKENFDTVDIWCFNQKVLNLQYNLEKLELNVISNSIEFYLADIDFYDLMNYSESIHGKEKSKFIYKDVDFFSDEDEEYPPIILRDYRSSTKENFDLFCDDLIDFLSSCETYCFSDIPSLEIKKTFNAKMLMIGKADTSLLNKLPLQKIGGFNIIR